MISLPEDVVQMKNELDSLIRSFEGVPIIRKGEYLYFVHPLSDGIPTIEPGLLEDAVTCVMDMLPPLDRFDLMITAEAMGIPLTTLLSARISKPFSIARKRKYGIKGEIMAKQSTGYSSSNIHLNLPRENGRAVIIDDVLSTGGTLISIANGLKGTGWDVECAVILFNKMGNSRTDLENEMGFPILTLLDVDLVDGSYIAKVSR